MIEVRTQTSKDRPYRTIEDGDDDDDRYDNDGGDDVHYDDQFGDDDDVIEMYR